MSIFSVEHCGCSLSGEVSGDGPPVVLIHGVAVHGAGWQPQVAQLAARHRCLTLDNRGMGRSQPPGAPITVAQMADDVRALMDAQGIASAHIVGHSLGGLVALHLALTARARVRSLALLCTFADGRRAAPLNWRMFSLGLRSRLGPRRSRRAAFLEILLPPAALAGADREMLAAPLAPLFGHDLADHPPVTTPQLKAMRACDATPRLRALANIPTLVVSAAHDPIAPPHLGRELAAGIPGARFLEIADAAHGVTLQQPGRINALLLEHFAQGETRSVDL